MPTKYKSAGIIAQSLPANAGSKFSVLPSFHMDTQYTMVKIDRQLLESILVQMKRAEGYCRSARSTFPFNRDTDITADPTEFYPGASGYAGATLRSVIQSIESSL